MTEFGFIDHIRRRFADLPDQGFEGIGDDCAVLPLGGEALVFTSDLLTEGVHFLRHATSARELGGKSLAVNLSDVAAMGARPVATLLSIALPPDAAGAWAEEFMEGYRESSARLGTPLVGGDTTRSESGVTINVTAIGRSPLTHLKRRRDARPGDALFVAGELGASGAGLRDLLAGAPGTPPARPYARQFYCGGSNGMRGWTPRTLGQGSVPDPHDAFPIQTGDVKLEANLELRFPIWGIVHGATFFDVGNVWYIKRSPDYSDDAVFFFDNFYKQLGFNTGFGLRFDIKFFVLRLDWGIQLHNPTTPAGERWLHNVKWQHTSLTSGVGYPF